jgi:hypothetical protein
MGGQASGGSGSIEGVEMAWRGRWFAPLFPPSAIQNRHVGVGGPQHELNVLEGAGCICASLGP